MSVKIRLARHGSKKRPFYRIVAANSGSPRNGRFLEVLGTYNPLTDPATISINEDKLKGWLSKGAKPTETVQHLITKKAG